MTWLDRLWRGLGLQAIPAPAVVALRRFSDELSAAALDLRSTSLRAQLLEQRVSELREECEAWEGRLARVSRATDPELAVAVARMAGRVEGQRQAASSELTVCLEHEVSLRGVLIDQRRRWFLLVEQAESMGTDLTGCLLHIDLSRPEPPDLDTEEDAERDFLARVIDGAPLN